MNPDPVTLNITCDPVPETIVRVTGYAEDSYRSRNLNLILTSVTQPVTVPRILEPVVVARVVLPT